MIPTIDQLGGSGLFADEANRPGGSILTDDHVGLDGKNRPIRMNGKTQRAEQRSRNEGTDESSPLEWSELLPGIEGEKICDHFLFGLVDLIEGTVSPL